MSKSPDIPEWPQFAHEYERNLKRYRQRGATWDTAEEELKVEEGPSPALVDWAITTCKSVLVSGWRSYTGAVKSAEFGYHVESYPVDHKSVASETFIKLPDRPDRTFQVVALMSYKQGAGKRNSAQLETYSTMDPTGIPEDSQIFTDEGLINLSKTIGEISATTGFVPTERIF